LEELQKEIRKGQKKLEALEPVNMLALEEYQKNRRKT
jgi:chromosome segregation protein